MQATFPTCLGLKRNLRTLLPLGLSLRKVADSPHLPDLQVILICQGCLCTTLFYPQVNIPTPLSLTSLCFTIFCPSHLYRLATFCRFPKCTETDQTHNLPVHPLVTSVSMCTAGPAPSLTLHWPPQGHHQSSLATSPMEPRVFPGVLLSGHSALLPVFLLNLLFNPRATSILRFLWFLSVCWDLLPFLPFILDPGESGSSFHHWNCCSEDGQCPWHCQIRGTMFILSFPEFSATHDTRVTPSFLKYLILWLWNLTLSCLFLYLLEQFFAVLYGLLFPAPVVNVADASGTALGSWQEQWAVHRSRVCLLRCPIPWLHAHRVWSTVTAPFHTSCTNADIPQGPVLAPYSLTMHTSLGHVIHISWFQLSHMNWRLFPAQAAL